MAHLYIKTFSNSSDMKRKEITLDERKQIQLDMLKEIDAFCRANNIRYSLAFGTLLGAVRHKGFIPWDDDVDIMMPYPDMMKFKELFKSQTLKYTDVDTDNHYYFPFSRVVNTATFSKRGLFLHEDGINIDLYPVISVPDDEEGMGKFFSKAQILMSQRRKMIKWDNKLSHFLPFHSIPKLNKVVKEERDFMVGTVPFGTTNKYYVLAGRIRTRKKRLFDYNIFDEITDLPFEGHNFMVMGQYIEFLEKSYGDYMQLPPEKERHPYHGGHYFWR